MRGYHRAYLLTDAISAVALVAIAVPSQLATSRLAEMPPVTGLYTFAAGAVLFALLGHHRQLIVGADSTIAPLFAAGIGHLAAPTSTDYIALVGLLAVMVGAMVALVGLLRFGWIAEFLSMPIITGFLAGVAVIIVVHQLPDLLGLPSVSGTTISRFDQLGHHLGHVNGWDVGIGLGVLAVMIGLQLVNRRLPGALIALVAATVLTGSAGLDAHGVAVLGQVAHSLPHVGLSRLSWKSIGSVAPIAAVVALVVISQSAATSRAFADKSDDRTDIDRDLVGIGAGSIVAGLVGAFPANASPGMTSAVSDAGGRTQLTALLASVVVLAAVPAAGVLRDLPDAALAGVLVYIAARIFHGRDLLSVLRFDLAEWGLAIITLLVVALVGVEQGIGVAVGLAILDRTRLSARPNVHVMERMPGTTSWRPVRPGDDPYPGPPGVLVLVFAAPLYYATASRFRAQVEEMIDAQGEPVRLLVLDVVGMHDVDYTAARTLRSLVDSLHHAGITVALARLGDHARANLEKAGLLQRICDGHVYDSVDQAVEALAPAVEG
jgi:SulP family sulfate permease